MSKFHIVDCMGPLVGTDIDVNQTKVAENRQYYYLSSRVNEQTLLRAFNVLRKDAFPLPTTMKLVGLGYHFDANHVYLILSTSTITMMFPLDRGVSRYSKLLSDRGLTFVSAYATQFTIDHLGGFIKQHLDIFILAFAFDGSYGGLRLDGSTLTDVWTPIDASIKCFEYARAWLVPTIAVPKYLHSNPYYARDYPPWALMDIGCNKDPGHSLVEVVERQKADVGLVLRNDFSSRLRLVVAGSVF